MNSLPGKLLNYSGGCGGMHIPHPAKALLDKSVIQAGGCSEFLAVLPGKWGFAKSFKWPGPGHAPDCSSVLRSRQAVCYVAPVLKSCSTLLHDGHNGAMEAAQHQQQNVQAKLETNDERRRRHLIELCKREGRGDINRGRDEIARCAGVSSDYLRQIIAGTPTPARSSNKDGERKLRQVGDDMARAIELGLGLPRGWMDNDIPLNAGDIVLGKQLTVSGVLTAARRMALHCDRMRERMTHEEFVGLLESAVEDLNEKMSNDYAAAAANSYLAGLRQGAQRRAKHTQDD